MLTVTSPENSFIQFPATDTEDDCANGLNMCLQVSDIDELRFQIKIPKVTGLTPLPGTFIVRICPDCGDPLEFVAPYSEPGVWDTGNFNWKASLDGDSWVGLVGWNPYPLDIFFQPRECFNLCLYGPESVKTTWTLYFIQDSLPWDNAHISFASGLSISGTHQINTIADLVSLLQSAFGGAGFTFTTAGSGIGLTITATHASGSLVGLGEMYVLSQAQPDPNTFSVAASYSSVKVKYECSNCLMYAPDPCFSTLIKYRSNENSMGFDYNNDTGSGNTLSSFYNQVRLSMFLKNPQFPTKKKVYRKSNGKYMKLSATMEEEFDCEVDWFNADWHRKLAVALEHDDVQFFNPLTNQWMELNHDESEKYDIDWGHNTRGTNFNNAPANFKIKLMPFANFNDNC